MIEKCDFGIRDISDHSPVYMTLALSNETKSMLWGLNVNVLRGQMKEEFIRDIQMYIQ